MLLALQLTSLQSTSLQVTSLQLTSLKKHFSWLWGIVKLVFQLWEHRLSHSFYCLWKQSEQTYIVRDNSETGVTFLQTVKLELGSLRYLNSVVPWVAGCWHVVWTLVCINQHLTKALTALSMETLHVARNVRHCFIQPEHYYVTALPWQYDYKLNHFAGDPFYGKVNLTSQMEMSTVTVEAINCNGQRGTVTVIARDYCLILGAIIIYTLSSHYYRFQFNWRLMSCCENY